MPKASGNLEGNPPKWRYPQRVTPNDGNLQGLPLGVGVEGNGGNDAGFRSVEPRPSWAESDVVRRIARDIAAQILAGDLAESDIDRAIDAALAEALP